MISIFSERKAKAGLLCLAAFLAAMTALTGCGDQTGRGGPAPGVTAETGSVGFRLTWEDPDGTSAPAFRAVSSICDYGITQVSARLEAGGNPVATGGPWNCTDRSGTLTNVPVGTYDLTVEGLVGSSPMWRGQTTGVAVTAGQQTDAGTITMNYVGNDTTPPTVSSTSPADGATGVSRVTQVSATFSEEIAAASIDSGSFTIQPAVSGSVSYDSNTRTATFSLDAGATFAGGQTYTATLTTDVVDLAGLHLAANHVWSFTIVLPSPGGLVWDNGNWDETVWY